MAESTGEIEKVKKIGKKSYKIIVVILFIVLWASSIFAVIALIKNKPHLIGIKTEKAQEDVKSEVETVVSEVSRFMALPKDESPIMATVTDSEKIKTQSFFKNSQSGDKLLVYQKSKKAILWRPSESKVIEVGNLEVSQKEPEASQSGVSQ